jgi:TetR/AcrR family transcriptional regulator, mexJK operon transcriptional repressor
MPRLTGQIDTAKTEAILDAAAEVLAERGLAAPIEEIARRAGVSKQTIYNRYGAKTELVRALVERRVDSITAPLRDPGAEDHPEQTLAAYARTLLQVISDSGCRSRARLNCPIWRGRCLKPDPCVHAPSWPPSSNGKTATAG